MNKLPELSVFFPAYNEAGNIEKAVKQALLVVPKIAQKYEIIIVNDGSTDKTLAISKQLAKKNKYVRVVSQKNQGYGGALKSGFASAKYDWVFYTDADLQFDMRELTKFIKYTGKYDLVIGFRKIRAEGWKRQLIASLLKIWNRIFLAFPSKIKDIDCAFKLMHKRVLRNILPLISDGAMVSTEILLKAYRSNFNIRQTGVNHFARQTGTPTGNNLMVIAKAVRDTFILKKHLFQKTAFGRYVSVQYRQIRSMIF